MDLAYVDNSCASESVPGVFNVLVGEILRTNEQVVVGPAGLGNFCDLEVFDWGVFRAKGADEFWDEVCGVVESVAGVGVEFGVDGERQEAVRCGERCSIRQAAYFLLAADRAGPGVAADALEDGGLMVGIEGGEGPRAGTNGVA
jgi:hypothetical protein